MPENIKDISSIFEESKLPNSMCSKFLQFLNIFAASSTFLLNPDKSTLIISCIPANK